MTLVAQGFIIDKKMWRGQYMAKRETRQTGAYMTEVTRGKKKIRLTKKPSVKALLAVIIVCICAYSIVLLRKQEEKVQKKAVYYGEVDVYSGENTTVPVSTAANGSTLDNRRILEDAEVENMLFQLAIENGDIAKIYADRENYPEELLTALAFNQEILAFVQGYPNADTKAAGGFTEEEKEQDFPLFLQWDSRWGYVPYGRSCIGLAGCGPTCLSMVIFSLTEDESATPDVLADYGMSHGYYVAGAGTDWSFMTDAAEEYGLSVNQLRLDETVMQQYLDLGYLLICSMGKGDFTRSGHFIVLYDYNEEGFLVNDPNSQERSERNWDFDTLRWQIKNVWGYKRA